MRTLLARRMSWLGTWVVLAVGLFGPFSSASAETFDWHNLGGQNWTSPAKRQVYGDCNIFGFIGVFEAKYKLTRNDPLFSPDTSEWNYESAIWDLGYWPHIGYLTTHGLVSEAECPYDSGTNYWPLQSGWENRVWKTAHNGETTSGGTTAGLKAELKKQGSVFVRVASGELFGSVAELYANPVSPITSNNHWVSLVGFHDDPALPSGGYWIIKNSWGTGWGQNGYGYLPYGNLEAHWADNNDSAFTAPVYYAGVMASATWNGGTGTWQLGNSTKWSGYVWENKETAATFGGTGGAVTLSGTVIAHGMTVNSAGYTFGGGALTITAGGITANESVAINSPLTIGGPQTWAIAAGKTLTVNSAMHTVISDTTITGAGDVAINGAIDGGGVLNIYGGAKPGGIIKNNTGTLTLAGNSNFGGDITANGGALYLSPSSGAATYSGAFFGNSALQISGNVSLGGGASNYSGPISVTSGSLTFMPADGMQGTFSGNLSAGALPVVHNGPGATVLSGASSYSGNTTIRSGALQANSGQGLPTGSFLILDGGVLQSNGAMTFTRALGTSGSNQFQWTANGGGFSGGAGKMTVNIGNDSRTLVWGDSVGSQIVGTLKLSSTTARYDTEFRNPINLNAADRTIHVENSLGSNSEDASITGVISSGSGTAGIIKTGSGLLILTAANTYNGTTTIRDGALQATIGTGIPANNFLLLDGGVYQSNGGYTFAKTLGTGDNSFQWTENGGGFSATSSTLTVNIGNDLRTLTWGSTPGTHLVGTLKLSSVSASARTNFRNPLDLGGGNRMVHVEDNPRYSSSDYAEISGSIGGTGNFTKTGNGVLRLSGSNTYSGTTTIAGGTLELSAASGYAVPGDLIFSAEAGCKVRLLGNDQIPATAKLTWITGGSGTKELQLNGRNLTVAGITSASLLHKIRNTASGAATLTVNNPVDCFFGGILENGGSGTLALVKTGPGTLTLDDGNVYGGSISYSGGTTISGGKLVLMDTWNANFTKYGIINNATLEFYNAYGDMNFSGIISGSGALSKKGGGTLTLSGSSGNTYAGVTNLQEGNLELNKTSGYAIPGNANFGGSGSYFISLLGNDQLPATAKLTWNSTGGYQELKLLGHNLTVAEISCSSGRGVIENTWDEVGYGLATLTVNNTNNCTFNGYIRNQAYNGNSPLALVKNGSATLTISGSNSGGYTGGLTVNNGTLNYSGGTLPNCNYTITGGTLNIGAKSAKIGTLKITGGMLGGTGTLTSNAAFDIQAGTVAAKLSGTNIPLTKTGSGAAILSGTNYYTGATTISGGVLEANSAVGLPTNSYLKLDGGVLQSNGPSALYFTRNLLATAGSNRFEWTARGGGFAAGTAPLSVRINGNLTAVNWADAEGANIAGVLMLSSPTAANRVDFQNPINLNGQIRTVFVENNPNSTLDYAIISGGIADGAGPGGLAKTGPGTLILSGPLNYTGNTAIETGVLQINSAAATLTTITGPGILSVGPTGNLTATSIRVDTLSLGTIITSAAVPEPSMLVLSFAAMLVGCVFFRRKP